MRYRITSVARDEAAIERLVAWMGWQAQVTNAPASRLPLGDSVLDYRAGTCAERAFHQLMDRPLGIRPLFVHRDDQVRGLTHLLTLALRILTLFEMLVWRGQDQDGEELAALYPGQAKRMTDRPTAQRVLEAVARTGVTLILMPQPSGSKVYIFKKCVTSGGTYKETGKTAQVEFDPRVPLTAVAEGPDTYVALGRDQSTRAPTLILVPKAAVKELVK